jgi:hypothetical protein
LPSWPSASAELAKARNRVAAENTRFIVFPFVGHAEELLAVDALFALSAAGGSESAGHFRQSVTADAVYSQADHQHGIFSAV